VDDFSFRLDRYTGLHPDIFETPDHGAHHGANPGASMIAAIPYAIFKPITDRVVDYTKKRRKSIPEGTAIYKDDRLARVKFYEQVREKGLDIKFGLIGFVTMVFCMAPLSALSAVAMFHALHLLNFSSRFALWMALLYAFGTPIFFRTAYLNQNLMVGIFSFLAFVLLLQIHYKNNNSVWQSITLAGFLAGLTILCDYSGLISLFMLYGYTILRRMDSVSFRQALKDSLWYFCGAAGPILLLWFYQWSSFGVPFYPPQSHMPPQTYSDIGYQGIRWPSFKLLWMLLFDCRFGLFVVSPVLLLTFCAPMLNYFKKNIVPFKEMLLILCFFIAFVIFLSSIEYTKLQWVSGIRYLVPVIPFLFMLIASVLVQIHRFLAYGITFISIGLTWAMSMARRGVGVPEESMLVSIKSILFEGLQLPWLNTLSKMEIHYLPFIEQPKLTAISLFMLCASIIYCIWRFRIP
jgi:MFS family permease